MIEARIIPDHTDTSLQDPKHRNWSFHSTYNVHLYITQRVKY